MLLEVLEDHISLDPDLGFSDSLSLELLEIKFELPRLDLFINPILEVESLLSLSLNPRLDLLLQLKVGLADSVSRECEHLPLQLGHEPIVNNFHGMEPCLDLQAIKRTSEINE